MLAQMPRLNGRAQQTMRSSRSLFETVPTQKELSSKQNAFSASAPEVAGKEVVN